MTRPAPVEIDFLGLEKGGASAGTSSIRGIQDALFGLDSQLLRSFLNSRRAAAVDGACCKRLPSPVPVMGLTSRSPVGSPPGTAAAPLTIFYNGTVSVFDLPRQKAEEIIRWAETSNAGVQRVERAVDALAGDGSQQRPGFLLDKLGGDIPLARKKSLQRFLEKRKESRLTAVLPCVGSTSSSSCDWAGDFGEDDHKGKSSWKRQKLSSM